MSDSSLFAKLGVGAGIFLTVAGAIKLVWTGLSSFFILVGKLAGTDDEPGVVEKVTALHDDITCMKAKQEDTDRGNLHIIDQQNAALAQLTRMREDIDRALYQLYPDSGKSLHDRVSRIEGSLETIRLQNSQRRPR